MASHQVQREVVDERIPDEPTACCPWEGPVLVEAAPACVAKPEDLSGYSLNTPCEEMSASRENSQQAAAGPCPEQVTSAQVQVWPESLARAELSRHVYWQSWLPGRLAEIDQALTWGQS